MLCEWGHERVSLFSVSGLKVEVTSYKIRRAQPILPLLFCFWSCSSTSEWKHWPSILASDLREKGWDANIISEYTFFVSLQLPPQQRGVHPYGSTSIICTNFWLWAVGIFVTESHFSRKIPTKSNFDLLEGSNKLQFYQEFHQQI